MKISSSGGGGDPTQLAAFWSLTLLSELLGFGCDETAPRDWINQSARFNSWCEFLSRDTKTNTMEKKMSCSLALTNALNCLCSTNFLKAFIVTRRRRIPFTGLTEQGRIWRISNVSPLITYKTSVNVYWCVCMAGTKSYEQETQGVHLILFNQLSILMN